MASVSINGADPSAMKFSTADEVRVLKPGAPAPSRALGASAGRRLDRQGDWKDARTDHVRPYCAAYCGCRIQSLERPEDQSCLRGHGGLPFGCIFGISGLKTFTKVVAHTRDKHIVQCGGKRILDSVAADSHEVPSASADPQTDPPDSPRRSPARGILSKTYVPPSKRCAWADARPWRVAVFFSH